MDFFIGKILGPLTAIGFLYFLYRLVIIIKSLPHNKGKEMLLVFDALYQIILDTDDEHFKNEYSALTKKYRNSDNELTSADANTLFLLQRDARKILLDIQRKYPELESIVNVQNDGEIELNTGIRI